MTYFQTERNSAIRFDAYCVSLVHNKYVSATRWFVIAVLALVTGVRMGNMYFVGASSVFALLGWRQIHTARQVLDEAQMAASNR